MKFKKNALVVILFTGIIGCECYNAGTEWNIDSFEISIFDKNGNVPIDRIIEGDSINLHIMFEAEFVQLISNPLGGFMNSALATSCEKPGDNGLKDEIEDFTITSDTKFNNIPVGEPLNELILVNGKESISEWISSSDFWMFRYDKLAELTILEKPDSSSTHIFTLHFVMESGNTIERDTDEIQWN